MNQPFRKFRLLNRSDRENRPNRRARKRNLGRGIYLLPTLLTTGNFFFGFYSIIASLNHRFDKAAWAILVAMVFDTFDGKVARMTKSTTRFGLEYDSLSDLISFGLAPGLLVYLWILQPFGRLGYMATFLYVICAALRLARFNVQEPTAPIDRFVGLPSPAAGLMIASVVILAQDFLEINRLHPTLLLGVVYFLAFLMVSGIPYRSFKDINLKRKESFQLLVLAVLLIYVSASIPEPILFMGITAYVLSGIVEWSVGLVRHKAPTPEEPHEKPA